MKNKLKRIKPKTRPAKILIGIPSGDMWFAKFGADLTAMCCYAMQTGYQLAIVNQNSSIIEVGRCEMVTEAFQREADFLLTLDSDMRFPPNLLNKLMAHRLDLVCCNAKRRRKPFTAVVTGLHGKPLKMGRGLVKCKGGTSAVQLVSIAALKRIPPPHYAVEWTCEGDMVKFVSEDYYFFDKAIKAGIDPYCDTNIRIGHIGLKEYYLDEDEGEDDE